MSLQAYIFLCTDKTEKECFEKNLFGGGKGYASQIKGLKKGDYVFLYNFTSEKLHGPFRAISEVTLNIHESAWGKLFPLQVKVKRDKSLKPLHAPEFDHILEWRHKSLFPFAKIKKERLEILLKKFNSPYRLFEEEIVYQSRNPARIKTLDGHKVRSNAERVIDNWLYKNNFTHGYETLVEKNEPLI